MRLLLLAPLLRSCGGQLAGVFEAANSDSRAAADTGNPIVLDMGHDTGVARATETGTIAYDIADTPAALQCGFAPGVSHSTKSAPPGSPKGVNVLLAECGPVQGVLGRYPL